MNALFDDGASFPRALLSRDFAKPRNTRIGSSDDAPLVPPSEPSETAGLAAAVSERHSFGQFEVRPAQRQVLIDGKAVPLGARAFDVLTALIERRDRLVTKRELLATVWRGTIVDENNLVVQIGALRKVLGADAIATVPGRGYKFVARVLTDSSAPRAVDALTTLSIAHANAPGCEALIGREQDLVELRSVVAAHRVVTITGAGGVGKTMLARHLWRELAHDPARQTAWVELSPLAGPAQLLPCVAQALGAPLELEAPAPHDDLIPELARLLRGRAMLLALDGAEHLVDEAARVASALMEQVPDLTLLVTSQAPLNLQAEKILQLEPLTIPPPGTPPSQALDYGAVDLFVRRAHNVDRRFELSTNNVGHVIEICRRLDGLPLAIELAAARAHFLGVTHLAAALDEPLRLLYGGQRTAPVRHHSLRATLEHSHDLLGEREQIVFRRLAVFSGDCCSLDLAQQLIADGKLDKWSVMDAMGELVSRSLLIRLAGGPSGYRLPETVRAFALDRLAAAGEQAQWRARYAAWMQGG